MYSNFCSIQEYNYNYIGTIHFFVINKIINCDLKKISACITSEGMKIVFKYVDKTMLMIQAAMMCNK